LPIYRALATRVATASSIARWPTALLRAALRLAGPSSGGPDLTDDATWLEEALAVKIEAIDRQERSAHVMRFLRPADAKSVGLCRVRLFQSHLTKLAPSITGSIG